MRFKVLPRWFGRLASEGISESGSPQLELFRPDAARPPWHPASLVTPLGVAALAIIGLTGAWIAGADAGPARTPEVAASTAFVPDDFDVPNDFPGAVRALEHLAGTLANPLMVRDSAGGRIRTSGAAVAVPTDVADSLLGGAQQRFLERGFFLFRHESNYGLEGRPDELALVPVWDQFRVVKVVGTSGGDSATSNASVVDWLRALQPDAPFILTAAGSDHVAGRFVGRLADPEAMARRIHAFCPDVVNQGTGSITDLAAELRRTNTFSCWWDRAG
jgi:hypothetical protein